jgi:phosphoribosylanthranilate isomerase
VVQLHGAESPEIAAALREGGWTVWKAIRLREPEELARAVDEYGAAVDGLLLEGWSPVAPGGTGTSFDWEALAARREEMPDSISLILAGGLNPGNVARAASLLRPAVVDVSTGVEHSPGLKDPAAVAAFVAAARGTRTESNARA